MGRTGEGYAALVPRLRERNGQTLGELCDGLAMRGPASSPPEGSELLPGISEGWPAILASLTTLLETGEPLPA